MTTYIGVADGQWRWTQGVPRIYNSSPGVERSFCGNCGSPLSFRSRNMSDMMHFFVAALDAPEAFAPTLHASFAEKLLWLKLADDLPVLSGPDYTKA
jgi:hypothetical protein